MPKVDLTQIPEACRLTVARAIDHERITRREMFNRLRPGDKDEYTWAFAPNPGRGPKQIKVVDGRSLTAGPGQGRDRFLQSIARERMEGSKFFSSEFGVASLPEGSGSRLTTGRATSGGDVFGVSVPAGSSLPASPGAKTTFAPSRTATPADIVPIASPTQLAAAGPSLPVFTPKQGDLFLSPVADRLPGEYEQKRVAERRLKLIEPVANGKYRYLGFSTKGDYLKSVASEHKVSVRSLQRWWDTYRENGQGVRGLQALMNDARGPERTGPRLEPWAKLFLETERLVNRSTREAAYHNLLEELKERQAAHGPAHIYQQPTPSQCYRYWASLGDGVEAAALEGRSAVKAAAMQISRTYADIYALDRVGVDEWICDVMTFDENQKLYPRGHQKRGQVKVGRYYLITMLDERSLYPLDAVICEAPNVESEIDLLVSVCLKYGVPGLINSDRGRFRGRVYSGKFLEKNRAPINAALDGIFDQLGIGRNLPREHNPQGNRLERFHLELARFARTLPGWVGADTVERQEKSNADDEIRQHEEWVRGTRPFERGTPLLTHDELLERIQGFFARWRSQHQSEGTDMNGLTPEMVFRRETPPQGFRPVSVEQLDRVTANVYRDRLVTSGAIEINEGKGISTRYYHHALVLENGERVTVLRSRVNRGHIIVLPPDKGSRREELIAPVLPRVGTSDPDHLAAAMAEKQFSRQLIEASLPQRPGSADLAFRSAVLPKSRDRINPDEMIAQSGDRVIGPSGGPSGDLEIGGPEWEMRYERKASPKVESEAPSLYDIGECQAEVAD